MLHTKFISERNGPFARGMSASPVIKVTNSCTEFMNDSAVTYFFVACAHWIAIPSA